ncbi:MAG: hypothetical protein JOZ39_11450 [Chloroflexi bacterium]|nr:hypothetical protein [Chloroflexota bacterium]
MFLKRRLPTQTCSARQFTVCIKQGDAWQTQEWTADQWLTWLRGLTPRQLVQHMSRWQDYSDRMPSLRDDFEVALADARRALSEAECVHALAE